MITQNVILTDAQEGKYKKWNKILIWISANQPFRNQTPKGNEEHIKHISSESTKIIANLIGKLK